MRIAGCFAVCVLCVLSMSQTARAEASSASTDAGYLPVVVHNETVEPDKAEGHYVPVTMHRAVVYKRPETASSEIDADDLMRAAGELRGYTSPGAGSMMPHAVSRQVRARDDNDFDTALDSEGPEDGLVGFDAGFDEGWGWLAKEVFSSERDDLQAAVFEQESRPDDMLQGDGLGGFDRGGLEFLDLGAGLDNQPYNDRFSGGERGGAGFDSLDGYDSLGR